MGWKHKHTHTYTHTHTHTHTYTHTYTHTDVSINKQEKCMEDPILNDELLIVKTFDKTDYNTIMHQLPKYSKAATQSLTNSQWKLWICKSKHNYLRITILREKVEPYIESMDVNIFFRVCGEKNDPKYCVSLYAVRFDQKNAFYKINIIPFYFVERFQRMKVECWMGLQMVNEQLLKEFYQTIQSHGWFFMFNFVYCVCVCVFFFGVYLHEFVVVYRFFFREVGEEGC